jgi:hypothetical protein
MARSEFGRSRFSNSSAAWRPAVLGPFSLPGHSRLRSTSSAPLPQPGQRRCMDSIAGPAMPVTAMTVPLICAGSSSAMTDRTVWIELISSPCTPEVRVMRLPGAAPRATMTGTCQCWPDARSTPRKYRRWIMPGSRSSVFSRLTTGLPSSTSPVKAVPPGAVRGASARTGAAAASAAAAPATATEPRRKSRRSSPGSKGGRSSAMAHLSGRMPCFSGVPQRGSMTRRSRGRVAPDGDRATVRPPPRPRQRSRPPHRPEAARPRIRP